MDGLTACLKGSMYLEVEYCRELVPTNKIHDTKMQQLQQRNSTNYLDVTGSLRASGDTTLPGGLGQGLGLGLGQGSVTSAAGIT